MTRDPFDSRTASGDPDAADARRPAASGLGPLETRVLDGLWRRARPQSVRELRAGFPGVAYTTLMTTLDRLYKKGLLDRERRGRAYVYVPRFSRSGLRDQMARRAIGHLLGPDSRPSGVRPILSTFVDEVGRRDDALLDALEEIIRARRRGEGR